MSAKAIEPEMVVIPGGPVTLGIPECPPEALVTHVWFRRTMHVSAFAAGRFAVTVGEYLAFVEATGYPAAPEVGTDPRFRDPRYPAAFVSWIDAVRYAQWLARVTGRPYRLLRDAEYERAARGGLEGYRFPWGDDAPDGRCDFANPNGTPKPVGSYPPNGYGLHDMAGSMWCWCEERFDEVALPDRARLNYDDTQIRDVRMNPVCRGGSFKTPNPVFLYCAYRHEDPIDGRFDCIGFRLALSGATE